MKNILTITIPGQPITKKNSQQIVYKNVNGKRIPFIIPSKQFLKYQDECGWLLKNKKGLNLSGRYNAQCIYYMKSKRRVDLVNLLEATMDIFVKYNILKDDDSEIIVSHDGSKVMLDKNNPRVEITLTDVL